MRASRCVAQKMPGDLDRMSASGAGVFLPIGTTAGGARGRGSRISMLIRLSRTRAERWSLMPAEFSRKAAGSIRKLRGAQRPEPRSPSYPPACRGRGEGGRRGHMQGLSTVDAATAIPSYRNSLKRCGEPHGGSAVGIYRTSEQGSALTAGLPAGAVRKNPSALGCAR